jgi:hypothetical protein
MQHIYGAAMLPDKETIQTFYAQALHDYLGAIDQLTDLYDSGKVPGMSDFVFAETRMKKSFEKLDTVIRIAKTKYDVNLGDMPIFLRSGGRS